MTWVAVAVGAAAVIGAGVNAAVQSDAARRAAHTQADSANSATGAQTNLAQQAIGAQATATGPWRNIGAGALYQLADLLGIDPRSAFPNGQGHQGPLPGQGSGALPGQQNALPGQPPMTPTQPGAVPGANIPGTSPLGLTAKEGVKGKSFLGDLLQTANPVNTVQNSIQGVQDVAHGHIGSSIEDAANIGFSGSGDRIDPMISRASGGATATAPAGTGPAATGASGIPGSELIPPFPTPGAPDAQFGSLLKPFGADTFQKDPGYDFRRSEGQKGVENSAAARGMQLSGAALKGVDRYNQDFASNEYNTAYNRYTQDQTNTYNRLANLAGLGQTSAQQLGSGAMGSLNNLGSQVGSNIIGAGNANAAGIMGQNNAIAGGISNVGNALSQQYYLGQLFGQGGGTPSMESQGMVDFNASPGLSGQI